MHSLKSKEKLATQQHKQKRQMKQQPSDQRDFVDFNVEPKNFFKRSPSNYLDELEPHTDDEKSLFKTASYVKEMPRNAIRTKLRKSLHKLSASNITNNSSETEDEPSSARSTQRPTRLTTESSSSGEKERKTQTTTTTKNEVESPTSKTKTTITTITTKTLIKINDLNRP